MSAAVRLGTSWTVQAQGESIPEFVARIPAGQAAPDGDCDKEDEWTSGGITIHVCVRCGDMSAQACEDHFQALVAELKKPENFPPDP